MTTVQKFMYGNLKPRMSVTALHGLYLCMCVLKGCVNLLGFFSLLIIALMCTCLFMGVHLSSRVLAVLER